MNNERSIVMPPISPVRCIRDPLHSPQEYDEDGKNTGRFRYFISMSFCFNEFSCF